MTLPLSDLERAAQRLQAAEAKVREFEGCFAPPTALTAQMIEAREAYEALANPATVLAMIERIKTLEARNCCKCGAAQGSPEWTPYCSTPKPQEPAR